MNRLSNPATGIITAHSVTFWHGKDQVQAENGCARAFSAALNGTFVSGELKGYATAFVDADVYNQKIAGKNVACVVQVLCTVDESEVRQNQANGNSYVRFHVVDEGRKLVKVTDGDAVAMSFTDETFPRMDKPERKAANLMI